MLQMSSCKRESVKHGSAHPHTSAAEAEIRDSRPHMFYAEPAKMKLKEFGNGNNA